MILCIILSLNLKSNFYEATNKHSSSLVSKDFNASPSFWSEAPPFIIDALAFDGCCSLINHVLLFQKKKNL